MISRKVVESEIWRKPPLYMKVWIYLLSRAQHKEYKNLKRGQLRTSIPEIIEACKWNVGARIERPTRDQIYQILAWLRKCYEGGNESNTRATMITTTKATHGLLVNIDNYNFYQDSSNYESNDESNGEKATKQPREQRQPDNINKNVKNDKNDKEDYTSKIKDLLPVFSSINNFNQLNKEYWDVIRETRKTGSVAKSVIYKTMDKWQKYNPVVIEYALKTHIRNHAGKDEKYTIGIMRRTDKDDAEERLKLTSVAKNEINWEGFDVSD